ncbi:MAG: four-carbon acid sugar kinase family protein [Bryobacteraceae bacterium]
MRASPTTNLECLLIADDLTGACDAAVHFARRGYQTHVRLDSHGEETSVLAISAESRHLNAAELRRVMDELAQRLPVDRARILFKKIDSTLRGNVGAEIAAALTAFGCEAAVITPAYPAMGRTVEEGYLRVRDAEAINLAARLRSQGLEDCAPVQPSAVCAAIQAGARFISIDAACDRDLDTIAAAGLESGRRILWSGSAGLASALARTLPWGGPLVLGSPLGTAPRPASSVLFCIGSDHPVTVEQQRRLLALGRSEHVVLNLSLRPTSLNRVRELVEDAAGAATALVLSGGDTASLVCRALGVRRIQLEDEIVPGIPWGHLSGGAFDGWRVATKSGGFGAPHALIQVADFFLCPTP